MLTTLYYYLGILIQNRFELEELGTYYLVALQKASELVKNIGGTALRERLFSRTLRSLSKKSSTELE